MYRRGDMRRSKISTNASVPAIIVVLCLSSPLSMAETTMKPSTEKTVTGMVNALDLRAFLLTIDDTQFQMTQNVQFVDEKDKVHQLRELLPSMTVTVTLDNQGQ